MLSLSSEQVSWICRNYAETRNRDLCEKFGISENQLRRVRDKHGLRKSERMRCSLSKAYCSEEDYAAMARRRGASLKEVYRKERRRVLFGIDQKTSLRVVRSPRCKYALRHKMRKRGYVVARGGNVLLVTCGTLRSRTMEEHAEGMGMRVVDEMNEEEVV